MGTETDPDDQVADQVAAAYEVWNHGEPRFAEIARRFGYPTETAARDAMLAERDRRAAIRATLCQDTWAHAATIPKLPRATVIYRDANGNDRQRHIHLCDACAASWKAEAIRWAERHDADVDVTMAPIAEAAALIDPGCSRCSP